MGLVGWLAHPGGFKLGHLLTAPAEILGILSAAILTSSPNRGRAPANVSRSPGSAMARRLLPWALLFPNVCGWLIWQGERSGYYGMPFGLILFSAANTIFLVFSVRKGRESIDALDAARSKAEKTASRTGDTLAAAESRYGQLADCMPQIVWTANSIGVPTYFNRRWYEYTGLNFEQAGPAESVSPIHPDDQRELNERTIRAIASREPYTLEYRLRRASDGIYRWHRSQATPLFGASGELLSWVGAATDIHDLKLAAAVLRDSEFQFRQMADTLPQIVWTALPDGNLDYYNALWYEYTGMSLEQTRNWGWQQVQHPEDLQNTIERWKHSIATCEPVEIEFRIRRAKDGAYHWHLSRGRAIRDAQGAVLRWFGTCTDIEQYKQAQTEIAVLNASLEQRVLQRTAELARSNGQLAIANEELKQASLRLEQSNAELRDFASVASHDLQEPLRKVQAFGDRLRTDYHAALGPQGQDYLNRMLKASHRMQTLIQDLLTFSRVASQGRPFLPVDLELVTREVLSDLEVRIAETNALVSVGRLPTIDADSMQMRQLLQNLIGNALKFYRKGAPVAVRVYAEAAEGRGPNGEAVRLMVDDDGIGFDEKYLDRIFGVFQRLNSRADYEGSGIGLAVCRKIAERHGGSITAKSVVGHGASFRVILPRRRAKGRGGYMPDGGTIPPGEPELHAARRESGGAMELTNSR